MFNVLFFWQIEFDFLACVDLIYVVSHRETIKYMNNMSGNHELEDETQKNKVRPAGRTLPKATDNSDMYSRAFPVGNALFFFAGGVMSLFRLPRGKFSLAFLAVPAGKDGRVECPCQTVDGFIGIRGSVCGLFLFVQTHAPLTVPPWQIRARKSKFHFYQAQGRGYFPPCACGWWLVDGLQVPVVMRFLYRSAFLQTVPYTLCAA